MFLILLVYFSLSSLVILLDFPWIFLFKDFPWFFKVCFSINTINNPIKTQQSSPLVCLLNFREFIPPKLSNNYLKGFLLGFWGSLVFLLKCITRLFLPKQNHLFLIFLINSINDRKRCQYRSRIVISACFASFLKGRTPNQPETIRSFCPSFKNWSISTFSY